MFQTTNQYLLVNRIWNLWKPLATHSHTSLLKRIGRINPSFCMNKNHIGLFSVHFKPPNGFQFGSTKIQHNNILQKYIKVSTKVSMSKLHQTHFWSVFCSSQPLADMVPGRLAVGLDPMVPGRKLSASPATLEAFAAATIRLVIFVAPNFRWRVYWLVVEPPSWKIWVRQWEGWHPIYYGK